MVFSIFSVKNAIIKAADVLIESKAYLEELDSYSGDGDLGISMDKGARYLKGFLDTSEDPDIGEVFIQGALIFNKAAPSTMGTLISSAMMAVGKQIKGEKQIDEKEIPKLLKTMTNAIASRGGAKIGDKTILDSMIPMSEAFESTYESGGDFIESLRAAERAAKRGVETTKDLIAKAGRARWIGERARGYFDSGAVLCWLIIKAFADIQ